MSTAVVPTPEEAKLTRKWAEDHNINTTRADALLTRVRDRLINLNIEQSLVSPEEIRVEQSMYTKNSDIVYTNLLEKQRNQVEVSKCRTIAWEAATDQTQSSEYKKAHLKYLYESWHLAIDKQVDADTWLVKSIVNESTSFMDASIALPYEDCMRSARTFFLNLIKGVDGGVMPVFDMMQESLKLSVLLRYHTAQLNAHVCMNFLAANLFDHALKGMPILDQALECNLEHEVNVLDSLWPEVQIILINYIQFN
jgi:hypothetical protein